MKPECFSAKSLYFSALTFLRKLQHIPQMGQLSLLAAPFPLLSFHLHPTYYECPVIPSMRYSDTAFPVSSTNPKFNAL